MRNRLLLPLLTLATAALVACGGSDGSDSPQPAIQVPGSVQEPAAAEVQTPTAAAPQPQSAKEPQSTGSSELAGDWRVYSARIFYDAGGGGTVDTTITRQLELDADGGWRFGSSSGSYAVSDISAEDWSRWAVEPYGPTRKITLFDWNDGTADGPVEESITGVDFLWVIYYEAPPVVEASGTVWMKFGHA